MVSQISPSFGAGAAKYGVTAATPLASPNPDTSAHAAVATASASDPGANLLHPSNPLLAFGVVAAVVFGLMAFSTSTSVRVGHSRAGAAISIGDSK